MKNNSLVIIMALVVASFLTLAYFQLQRPKADTVPVLTTTKKLADGEKIMPATIAWRQMPRGEVKPGYITEKFLLEKVIGSKAAINVAAGKPLLLNEIKIIPGGIPAKLLNSGMYAVSVGFPRAMAMAKLISPGDKIDILLMRKNGDVSYIKPLLTSITVMNIAPPYADEKSKDENNKRRGKDNLPSILVLAMNAEQLKMFNLSSEVGTLRFVLKSAYQEDESAAYFDYMVSDKNQPKMQAEQEIHAVERLRSHRQIAGRSPWQICSK